MAAILWESEICKTYENEIRSQTNRNKQYYLCAEVNIRFEPYSGEGFFLETCVEDESKVEQFLPAIKRGLIAGKEYYNLLGLKAVWTGCSLGSKDACDVALSWAAALTLRDAIASDPDADSTDEDWLKKIGLYTEDSDVLGRYFDYEIYKEHPWTVVLRNEHDTSKRLDIIREAVAADDCVAKLLLLSETDDEQESFRIMKEIALEDNDEYLLAEVCKRYENGSASDDDAVECYIRLGDVYRDQSLPDEMGATYEKAWSHAQRLEITSKQFISAFAERIGDMYADNSSGFYNSRAALRWYERADSERWEIRVKSALLTSDVDECIYLGTCYANGILPAVVNEELARELYFSAQTELAVTLSVCGFAPRLDELNELLGDLYAREDGKLYNYEEALRCYKFAAKTRSTAKEKVLKLMRRKKELGAPKK